MQRESLLTLGASDGRAPEMLRVGPAAAYTEGERRLSAHIECEIDRLVLGHRNALLLLKLYPRRENLDVVGLAWSDTAQEHDVRPESALRIAEEALEYFGPRQAGIVVQEALDDVIVQSRRYSTCYPHINLERYEFYDGATREPLLGAWRARRIQNQRRETRTNRMIDAALLSLEVGKAVFSLLP